jgi:hypothetical protein
MDIPDAVVAIVGISSISYTVVSVAKAFSSRRATQKPADALGDARLARLEHAVEAIALEIERISEGQRFTTKLLIEESRQKNNLPHALPSHTPP